MGVELYKTNCYNVLIILIIFIVSLMPLANKKVHFNLSMITEGYFNKLLIIAIVFLLIIENQYLGLLGLVLLSSLLFIDPNYISEGFIPYFKEE
mgnify:CR=1 FL=1